MGYRSTNYGAVRRCTATERPPAQYVVAPCPTAPSTGAALSALAIKLRHALNAANRALLQTANLALTGWDKPQPSMVLSSFVAARTEPTA